MEITEFFVKTCIIFHAIRMVATGSLQLWTFEFLEVNTETSDPDIVDIKLEIVRLGRWEYGFSGFFDSKVDMYDNFTVRVIFERSKDRAGPYSLLPMSFDNQTLSRAMNGVYKTFLQTDAMKCCDNAPIVKNKFQPPLTKRFVTITNCTVSNDNSPSILMEGYYKVRILLSGPVEVVVEFLSLIEPKTF